MNTETLAALDALNMLKKTFHSLTTNPDRPEIYGSPDIQFNIILKALMLDPVWMDISGAKKIIGKFLCRKKSNPRVTFEAIFNVECESWEIPELYYVLHNLTLDEPIDGDYSDYEWTPITPKPEGN